RGGGGRSGEPSAASGHLLLPLCRWGSPAPRVGPTWFRGLLRLFLYVLHPAAEPCPGGDGSVDTRQRPRVPAPGDHGRAGRALPLGTTGGGGDATLRGGPVSLPTAGSGGATEPDEILDCLGQRCPLPVIALAKRLPRVPIGGVVRVLADDPAASNDIAAWCRL